MNTGSPVGAGLIGGNTGSVSGMMESDEEDIVFCDYILKSAQEYLKDFDETTPEYNQAKAYMTIGKQILSCDSFALYILVADANFANLANVRSLFTTSDKKTGIVATKYSLNGVPFIYVECEAGVLWLFNGKSHACCVLKAYEDVLATEKE